MSEEDNPSFLAQVARKFRRKDSRIIVACGNGKSHSIDVLEALEEEGFTNIVGMMVSAPPERPPSRQPGCIDPMLPPAEHGATCCAGLSQAGPAPGARGHCP